MEKEQICTKSEILPITAQKKKKGIWVFILRLKVQLFHSCASHFYAPFPSLDYKLQNSAGKMLFPGGKIFLA